MNGAVVVDVEGKLVGGPESGDFHGLIKRLLEDGEKRIVINLQETPWANSQGIGLLIGALTSVTNAGGKLALAQAGERIVWDEVGPDADGHRRVLAAVQFERFDRQGDAEETEAELAYLREVTARQEREIDVLRAEMRRLGQLLEER